MFPELEGGRDEPALWRPGLGREGEGGGQLEGLQPSLRPVGVDGVQDGLANLERAETIDNFLTIPHKCM